MSEKNPNRISDRDLKFRNEVYVMYLRVQLIFEAMMCKVGFLEIKSQSTSLFFQRRVRQYTNQVGVL